MISTHFSLSFLIKVDMFFPESVVFKSYEVLMLCWRDYKDKENESLQFCNFTFEY